METGLRPTTSERTSSPGPGGGGCRQPPRRPARTDLSSRAQARGMPWRLSCSLPSCACCGNAARNGDSGGLERCKLGGGSCDRVYVTITLDRPLSTDPAPRTSRRSIRACRIATSPWSSSGRSGSRSATASGVPPSRRSWSAATDLRARCLQSEGLPNENGTSASVCSRCLHETGPRRLMWRSSPARSVLGRPNHAGEAPIP